VRWPSAIALHTAEHRRGLCVLAFHRVVERCEKDHDITWRSFRTLLDGIAADGVPSEARLAGEDGLRRRAVALTFDDGTADHLQVGEELARRGMPGVFFVPAGKVDRPHHLTMPHLRELSEFGHRVGSHGFSHLPLGDEMPPQVLTRELRDSKTLLEDAIGNTVEYFAPPGGFERAAARHELRAHGYTAARSMRWGIYASVQDRWSIPCVPVTEFTLARGWVMHALRLREVPLVMRSGWALKRLMPAAMRLSVRKRLHDPFRAGR
jgi:polysaccharide deacetylase